MARVARGFGMGALTALAMSLAPLPAIAQSSSSVPLGSAPSSELDTNQAALADVEASLSLSQDRIAALKAEIDAMKGDRDKQNAALIAAAERVKLAQADVDAIERKIGDLIVSELETRGRLDGADSSISNVLAALERISHDPPPALIVDPSDALGSARGAMLISAILPQLQAKADQVMADLKHLGEIKAQAQIEELTLKANFSILEEEQLRIATLLAAQKATEETKTASLANEQQAADELTAKAASLKQLIGELSRKAQAVATAADATARANAGMASPRLDPETVRLALANTARTQPAVPFAAARGYLAFPTSGVPVTNYGDSDGFGGISKGLSVVTRADAQVTAPADGWVVYAGTYLNYGQIVILDAGQDYTILLAGLGKASVRLGQFVLMGQPVGAMGSRMMGRAANAAAGASTPTLYIEMRKDNLPIDPTGWWATPGTPTQSG